MSPSYLSVVFLKRLFELAYDTNGWFILVLRDRAEVPRKKQMVTLFLCASALWSIWKSCNNLVFNKKVLPSLMALVYKMLMLSKSWCSFFEAKIEAYGGRHA